MLSGPALNLRVGLFRPVPSMGYWVCFDPQWPIAMAVLNCKPETGQQPLLARPVISDMEHKGVEYQIIPSAHPTGWRWTVHLDDGHSKTGVSSSRQYAIYDATNAIEKALSAPPKAK